MKGRHVFVVALLAATSAFAADPAQQCQSGKNRAVAKYTACRLKADARFALNGSVAKRDEALAKCASQYSAKWASLEQKATDSGGDCPDAIAAATVQTFTAACTDAVATALDGGTLPVDIVTCSSDLATTNAGTAVAGDVLSSKTFSSGAGLGVAGTMTNNGGVMLTPTTSNQSIAAGYHDGSGVCAGDADLVAANVASGVNLFGINGTALPSKPFATGQTECYDGDGNTIDCTGTGQDGELQKGAARQYVDNLDGTISDLKTGLMWEKLALDGSIHDVHSEATWINAFDKIDTLNTEAFAGYTDWRLPNVDELASLAKRGLATPAIDPAFKNNCGGGCTVYDCSCTSSYCYWTSSTFKLIPTIAWIVNFHDGYVYGEYKTELDVYVRAVRGGA